MDRKQARLGMAGNARWSLGLRGDHFPAAGGGEVPPREVGPDDGQEADAAVRHADLDPAGVGGGGQRRSQFPLNGLGPDWNLDDGRCCTRSSWRRTGG